MKITPTLKNIAAVCGVSHVTVWRALRNHESVHPKTAAKIQKYAREAGWEEETDSRVASSRKRPYSPKKSHPPIIFLRNLENQPTPGSLLWDYFSGIVEATAESEHPLRVVGFPDRSVELERIRALVEKEGAGGFLEFGLQENTVDYLSSQGIPFVTYQHDVFHPDPKRPVRVYADHIQGFLDAWRFVLAQGHERIGFIGHEGRATSQARLNEGLAAAQLLSRQKGFDAQAFIPPDQEDDLPIWTALEAQLGKWTPQRWPTAFFCTNDRCAYRVISSLQAHGLQVPRDLSVIGFDDAHYARLSRPELTTIAKPRKAIGKMMFHMLEEMIRNKPDPQQTPTRAIPMHLIVRDSVAKVSPTDLGRE